MRRHWRWPILEALRGVNWFAVWLMWSATGHLVTILPATIVDSDPHGNIYFGAYLLVALVIYGVPSVGGLLVGISKPTWHLLRKHGPKLIPRRVTEPVHEDLRTVPRNLY